MTAPLTALALPSLTAGAGYLLLKLLLALWGGELSQRWRCHSAFAVALLFLLPLYRLWGLAASSRPSHIQVQVMALTSSHPPSFSWDGILECAAVLWTLVVCLRLLWDVWCLLRFRRQRQDAERIQTGPLAALAQEEAQRLGIHQAVRLLVSPAVNTPMLVGFLCPVLLLPSQDLSAADARLILAHELVHYRRGDLWKKLLMEAVCILHWFNPAAHLLKRDFLYWMETACDEAVVSSLNFTQRKQYGYLLIDGANPIRPPAQEPSMPFAPGRETLERRITTMLQSNHKAHSALGGVLAMALAAGCLVTTAFAADLDKNHTLEAAAHTSVSVAAVNSEDGSASPALNEEVTYTVVASDESIELNGSDLLSLADMEDLGDGSYQVVTNVDGEEIVLTVHVDTEE